MIDIIGLYWLFLLSSTSVYAGMLAVCIESFSPIQNFLIILCLLLSIIIVLMMTIRIKKNRNRNKLFSILSHDLKNNAIAIKQVLMLMNDSVQERDNDELRTQHRLLLQASDMQIHLLNNVIMWTRLRLHSLSVGFSPCNVGNIFRDLNDLFAQLSAQKDIRIHFENPDNIIVQSDRNLLLAILRNLISNALKFSHRGDQITVSVTRKGETSLFAVTDHGLGMTAEMMASLLTSNPRKTHSGTEGETGSGLGIDLCRDLLSKLGSKLHIVSTLEKGSTFSFIIYPTKTS